MYRAIISVASKKIGEDTLYYKILNMDKIWQPIFQKNDFFEFWEGTNKGINYVLQLVPMALVCGAKMVPNKSKNQNHA